MQKVDIKLAKNIMIKKKIKKKKRIYMREDYYKRPEVIAKRFSKRKKYKMDLI